jgi:hypothetical protein
MVDSWEVYLPYPHLPLQEYSPTRIPQNIIGGPVRELGKYIIKTSCNILKSLKHS